MAIAAAKEEMRVLLAEDNAGLRGVLKRGLKEEGCIVDAASSGNEALHHLSVFEIARQAWPEGADAVMPNTVDVHVARLRAKLARFDARIETFRRAGFRLVASSK